MSPISESVDFCLVCEDIRPEFGNKVTILGYYGLLPHVRIIIDNWEGAMEKLTFLVGTHGLKRQFSAQVRLVNPDGSTLLFSNTATGEAVTDSLSTFSIAFAFPFLKFQQQGAYTVEVSVDGTVAYKNTFLVQSSRPTVKTS